MNTYTHYEADELATLRIAGHPPTMSLGGYQVSWANIQASTYVTADTAQAIADAWNNAAAALRLRELDEATA